MYHAVPNHSELFLPVASAEIIIIIYYIQIDPATGWETSSQTMI
jgi:hypothetical protein